jgi:hypothetical protein
MGALIVSDSREVPKSLSVKLEIDVIESARIVAAYRGETMTEMLSEILRPILAKMEQEAVAKRHGIGAMPTRGKGKAKGTSD